MKLGNVGAFAVGFGLTLLLLEWLLPAHELDVVQERGEVVPIPLEAEPDDFSWQEPELADDVVD